MKVWILLITCLIVFPATSNPEISYSEESPEVIFKEREFVNDDVRRFNDLVKYVLIPLEKKFGVPYKEFMSRHWRQDCSSQHYDFGTVDLDFDLVGIDNAVAFQFTRDSLPHDQLIQYHRGAHMSHFHISLDMPKNRFEVLRCFRWNKKVWYKEI